MTASAGETHRRRAFPVSWVTTGKHLLLIGGCDGDLCRLYTALGFDWETITLFRRSCTAELCSECPRDPRVQVIERLPEEQDIAAADLIIESTMCRELGERIYSWATQHRVPVSCMDKIDLCDFHYPALLMRGPLIIAMLTGGTAPALSARLRKELDRVIGPGWETAARLFKEKRESMPSGESRNDLLTSLAGHPDLIGLIQDDNEAKLRAWMDL